MNVYADTSFFVSLYLPDRHSSEAQGRLTEQPRLWLTPLHRAEWTHAIAQHVFLGKMSAREAQRVYRDFEKDRTNSLWAEIDLPDAAFELLRELPARQSHGPILLSLKIVPYLVVSKRGSTPDTLHVAAALELGAEHFWTFDERQAKLAKAGGLELT